MKPTFHVYQFTNEHDRPEQVLASTPELARRLMKARLAIRLQDASGEPWWLDDSRLPELRKIA